MKKEENIGGLGVKMIDGNGNFLPESKRSFPSPIIAFYKIFGLSYVFPNSKTFGQYHLSYLDKNKIHEVDVLSGAFFLTKKNIIKKVGLLDEKFFMYGNFLKSLQKVFQFYSKYDLPCELSFIFQ